jgi:hypothetical protein
MIINAVKSDDLMIIFIEYDDYLIAFDHLFITPYNLLTIFIQYIYYYFYYFYYFYFFYYFYNFIYKYRTY